MRWGAMTHGGIYLLRWARSLGYRALIALVVLGLVWGLSQAGGSPKGLPGKVSITY